MRALLVLSLAAILAGLSMAGCSEPPPAASQAAKAQPPVAVTEVRLIEPARQGDAYRVEATLSHGTPGGTAGITFRLRNTATGETFQKSGTVQLTPGIVLVAVGEVQAPPGGYTPEVEVQYPPR